MSIIGSTKEFSLDFIHVLKLVIHYRFLFSIILVELNKRLVVGMNAIGFQIFEGIKRGVDHQVIGARTFGNIDPHFKLTDYINF